MSWRHGGCATIDNAILDAVSQVQIQRFPAGVVEVEELAEEGAGKVLFSTASTSILILPDNNNHPISWYFENKCADGAVLTAGENEIYLHVVELKSKLTPNKWTTACRQLRGMLTNSLAVAGALSLDKVISITCYVAYNTETISNFIKTNTAAQKQMVGTGEAALGPAAASYHDFTRSRLTLLDGQSVPIELLLRDNYGNASVNLHI